MRLRDFSETKIALGGDVSLTFVTDMNKNKVDDLFTELWRQIYSFERKFSRFLPSSELSVLNRLAGLKTEISPALKEILEVAKNLGIKTNGLYNPFIAPAMYRAGYKTSALAGYENDASEDYSTRRIVTIDNLQLGDNWAQIPFGTALDLGGCGKGYLADQLSKLLDLEPIKGYWLSLGGDIVTKGVDADGNNISVSIQSSDKLDAIVDWVIDCPTDFYAIATSGTFRRKNHDNLKNHHIINPNTSEPALTDIKLATVCASSAVEADVLASCAVVLGSKVAPKFLNEHGVSDMFLQGENFKKAYGDNIRKYMSNQSVRELQNA